MHGRVSYYTYHEPMVPSKHGKGNGIPIKYFTTLSSIDNVLGKSRVMFPLNDTYNVPGVMTGTGVALNSNTTSDLSGSAPATIQQKVDCEINNMREKLTIILCLVRVVSSTDAPVRS